MTLQEIYDKVMASEELKRSFAEAAGDKGKLEAWLKANGSDATAEQVSEFLKAKQTSGEVSDDDLENVAGGYGSTNGPIMSMPDESERDPLTGKFPPGALC